MQCKLPQPVISFRFLADDMVINGNDFSRRARPSPAMGASFLLIFHMRREDTGTLAAITENGDTLAARFHRQAGKDVPYLQQ